MTAEAPVGGGVRLFLRVGEAAEAGAHATEIERSGPGTDRLLSEEDCNKTTPYAVLCKISACTQNSEIVELQQIE